MRKKISTAKTYGNIVQMYFDGGIRILARKTPQGWQLVKFNFNTVNGLENHFADSIKVKGEFLRNGRVWTDTARMGEYLRKYTDSMRKGMQQYRGNFTAFDRNLIYGDKPEVTWNV